MSNGKLYIVGTPIGNLEDITIRALRTLEETDGILCEDTRQTLKLLNYYDIKNELTAYHKFNEHQSLNKVLDRLKQGEQLALVSDAGLPLISDPGSLLVKACRENGIDIEVIPGANAALSALQLSGLDASRFTFFGFPGKSKKEQRLFTDEIMSCDNTAIIYESPHHLLKTLEMIDQRDPERELSISREITKKFQETVNGTARELINYFTSNPPKGEFVIIINKGKIKTDSDSDITVEELYEKLKREGFKEKDAIREIARLKNMSRRDVYTKCKIEKN